MSRLIAVLLALSALLGASLAHAAPADAREVARLNNCTPKKIEALSQSLGDQGTTLYNVTCVLPKGKEDAPKGPDALLIKCDGSICEMLRPIKTEQK